MRRRAWAAAGTDSVGVWARAARRRRTARSQLTTARRATVARCQPRTERRAGRGAAALDGAARGVLASAAAAACLAAEAALARASAALAARLVALAGRLPLPGPPPRVAARSGHRGCAGVWGAAAAQRFANEGDSSAPKPSSPSSTPRPPRPPSEGPPPMPVLPPKPPKALEPLEPALPLPRRSRRMCSVRAWPEPEEACASAKPSCCSSSAQTSCRYHLSEVSKRSTP